MVARHHNCQLLFCHIGLFSQHVHSVLHHWVWYRCQYMTFTQPVLVIYHHVSL